MKPHESWKYDAVGKPLWSKAEGRTRLEDLGDGRTRIHFSESYHAFNPVTRFLLERRVHQFISRDNDKLITKAVNSGLKRMRSAGELRPEPGLRPEQARASSGPEPVSVTPDLADEDRSDDGPDHPYGDRPDDDADNELEDHQAAVPFRRLRLHDGHGTLRELDLAGTAGKPHLPAGLIC